MHGKLWNTDIVLLSLIVLTILGGTTLLYSANHFDMGLPLRQLAKGGTIAVCALVPLRYIESRYIRDLSMPMYLVSVGFLFLVLLIGYTTKGAQRWLDLFFFRFEPSELVKITLPLALAAYIHQTGIPIRSQTLVGSIIMILLPFLLSLLSVMIASPILWTQMHPYQQQRVMTLLSVDDDLRHHGYHIHQSKIAIGSGGLWGKGLGKGSQVQLGYIPEHKTDFIFTLMSEEFGFMGNMLWFLLILSIGFRSVYLGYQQAQTFNKIVCIALGFSFMLHAWINMAMVSGLLPVVGIPLPLISYGATNFASTLITFGLILKLGHTDPRRQHLW